MLYKNISIDNLTDSPTVNHEVIHGQVWFWLFLIFLMPSIICSTIVVLYILLNRSSRHALYNHVIFVDLTIGLISEVTLYPWILYYYNHDEIWHRSPAFCAVWNFIDSGLYVTQVILFSWATVERHILIFHNRIMMTKWKRVLVHYFPLTFILLYCLIYYSVSNFFPPCENHVDDSYRQCYYLCFYDNYALFMYESLVHEIIPTIIIILSSAGLLVRVVLQKRRVNQVIRWRKRRKMAIQSLAIALLFILFFFPVVLMNFMYLCGMPSDVGAHAFEYVLFFSYFMPLLLPFTCLLSLPELQSRIRRCLHFQRRQRRICPETFAVMMSARN